MRVTEVTLRTVADPKFVTCVLYVINNVYNLTAPSLIVALKLISKVLCCLILEYLPPPLSLLHFSTRFHHFW